MNRGQTSEDEQGYTDTGRTVVRNQKMNRGTQSPGEVKKKSEDEQRYTVTGPTVVKNQKMNRGTQSPGEPW